MTLGKKSKKPLLVVVFLCLLTAIVFFPQILSTVYGKHFFLHYLEAKTNADVSIDSLHLSWFGPQEIKELELQNDDFKGLIRNIRTEAPLWKLPALFDLENYNRIQADYHLEGGSFQVFSKKTGPVLLEKLNASFVLKNGSATFFVKAQSNDQGKKGSLFFDGNMRSLYAPQDELTIQLKLSDFPTLPIARYLSFREKIDEKDLIEILGDSFQAQGSLSLKEKKGDCALELHSPHIQANLLGELHNNILTLREPFAASFQLTKVLAKKILNHFNPLFITGISSESPIQLRIDPYRFQWNLDNTLSWSQIQIEHGVVNTGKIQCGNGFILNALIGLLKMQPFVKAKEMQVWFTPLTFRLKDSILFTERMDALAAGSLRFCTWGNLNLEKESIDMILGLTAETLRKLGIKRVPSTYVLKIGLNGTIDHPKLAIAAGTAQLAALIAAQHKAGGGVSGGLLNLFTQPEHNVPLPKHPLPWEYSE